MIYSFTLPLPPSINNSVWISKGRIIQKDSCRAWKKEADLLLRHIPKQEKDHYWEVALTFTFFYVKKPRHIDTDNRTKPIFDALANRIGIDDSWLHFYSVAKEEAQGKEPHKVTGQITIL